MDLALKKLMEEVKEGLEHGFFDFNVTCDIVGGRRRDLIIKAGKSYKFTIPEEDILDAHK